MAKHDLRRGALLVTAAALLMAVLNALQKRTGSRISAVEILFFRNLFSIPFVLAVAARGGIVLRTKHFRGHVARSVIGLVSMGMVVVTLPRIPLAEQQVLSYTQPLFLVMLSVPLLGERPSLHRWLAVALGFAGVLVVAGGSGLLGPGSITAPRWAAAVALAQGAMAALTVIQIRQLSQTERSTTIALWQAILMTAFSAILLPLFWKNPTLPELATMLLIGVLAGLVQMLQAEAFASAQISAIGPFGYSGLFWAALIGWIGFGEKVGPALLAGSVLIVAAGIWMLVHDSRVTRRRTRPVARPR